MRLNYKISISTRSTHLDFSHFNDILIKLILLKLLFCSVKQIKHRFPLFKKRFNYRFVLQYFTSKTEAKRLKK